MKFGPVAISDAVGAVLAHATTAGEKRFRKAHVLGADDIAVLKAAGIETVVAARLSDDDLGEDIAATHLAEAMRYTGVEARPASTGRVNLHALETGVFTVDKAMVDRVNAIDPSITVATVAHYDAVEAGGMVATVKIIPFAVAKGLVEQAVSVLKSGEIIAVHPFTPMRVGVVQTVLPTVKESVLAKTIRITQARLARSGSAVGSELRTPHEAAPVAEAIRTLAADHDMVIVFGASALCDFDDVIPAAIRGSGGEVLRAGMPVDPGNLLVLGRRGEMPVVGAPGCARSPKENGFDWVLDRLIAGLDVTSGDIAGMGVGGLLMEIPTRPQPREVAKAPAATAVHAIVLAAGRSSRMGGPNKLMALFDGQPLIRQSAERALASGASGATVVTGHQAERIRQAVSGLDVQFAHNPDFADGLSGSLKVGIAAAPPEAAGALIVLGDMPVVSSVDLDRLIAAFQNAGGQTVVRATHNGKRGNPVLLPRSLFGAVAQLQGDTGARHLVEAELMPVIDVEIGEGAGIDVDTRDAMESAGGVLQD